MTPSNIKPVSEAVALWVLFQWLASLQVELR